MNDNNASIAALPWWKFGYVWLVVAGPAIVVAASMVTLYLVITRPDEVVSDDHYHAVSKTLAHSAQSVSLAPALQARNHAATGVVPAAKP